MTFPFITPPTVVPNRPTAQELSAYRELAAAGTKAMINVGPTLTRTNIIEILDAQSNYFIARERFMKTWETP